MTVTVTKTVYAGDGIVSADSSLSESSVSSIESQVKITRAEFLDSDERPGMSGATAGVVAGVVADANAIAEMAVDHRPPTKPQEQIGVSLQRRTTVSSTVDVPKVRVAETQTLDETHYHQDAKSAADQTLSSRTSSMERGLKSQSSKDLKSESSGDIVVEEARVGEGTANVCEGVSSGDEGKRASRAKDHLYVQGEEESTLVIDSQTYVVQNTGRVRKFREQFTSYYSESSDLQNSSNANLSADSHSAQATEPSGSDDEPPRGEASHTEVQESQQKVVGDENGDFVLMENEHERGVNEHRDSEENLIEFDSIDSASEAGQARRYSGSQARDEQEIFATTLEDAKQHSLKAEEEEASGQMLEQDDFEAETKSQEQKLCHEMMASRDLEEVRPPPAQLIEALGEGTSEEMDSLEAQCQEGAADMIDEDGEPVLDGMRSPRLTSQSEVVVAHQSVLTCTSEDAGSTNDDQSPFNNKHSTSEKASFAVQEIDDDGALISSSVGYPQEADLSDDIVSRITQTVHSTTTYPPPRTIDATNFPTVTTYTILGENQKVRYFPLVTNITFPASQFFLTTARTFFDPFSSRWCPVRRKR